MRKYTEEKSTHDELVELNAEEWMVDLLKLNPDYVFWGPGEDYMCKMHNKGGDGWNASLSSATWKDFGCGLDDLNEVVNFYFEINRDHHDCPFCDGSGLNPESHEISETFYDFDDGDRRWCDKITQDEVQALWDAGRLKFDFKTIPTAEQVNAWERGPGFGHDAINRWILIKARCQRLGVWGHCTECSKGSIFDEVSAHVSLVVWVLHPRKGASRGWRVDRIEREDLPEVFEFLHSAAMRNAQRFSNVVEAHNAR